MSQMPSLCASNMLVSSFGLYRLCPLLPGFEWLAAICADVFFIDWIMNSRAFGLNFGNERLFMRDLDENSADLADCDVEVTRAVTADDVSEDVS